MAFNYTVQFFDHIQLFHFFREFQQTANGQRMDEAELEDADRVSEYFFYILISGAGGDDTNVRAACFDAVVRTVFRKFRQSGGTCFDNRMAALCIARAS